LTILKDRDALARERAATWRSYGWAGVKVAAPQALMWGIPHTASGKVSARLKDILANRKRFSVFGTTEAVYARFLREMRRFKPHYLYGYVSAVAEFSDYLLAASETLPPSIKCVITTAELLDAATRATIRRATGLPVFNEYGCGEVGSIAHECDAGGLHVQSENLIVEVVPLEEAINDDVGEIVVTDLHNRAMPLIRYRTGDLGQLASASCPCGKPYPVLKSIVGRAYDLIRSADGKTFHPESVLYIFEDMRRSGKTLPPFQAVQQKDGEITIYFEQALPTDQTLLTEVELRFRSSFRGELSVKFATTDRLVREPSGKLRIVKRLRHTAFPE